MMCSAPKNIHLPAGNFDLKDIDAGLDRMGRVGKKKTTVSTSSVMPVNPCAATGTSIFSTALGCQDDHLVAYAPYDTMGDMNMYVRGSNAPLGRTAEGMTGMGYPHLTESASHVEFSSDSTPWESHTGSIE